MPNHNFDMSCLKLRVLNHSALFGLVMLLSACSNGSPLSAIGIGSAPQEPIDYSPRAPLVMPPAEQRGVLPPPQDAMGQSLNTPPPPAEAMVQPPPEAYGTPAPVDPNAPREEKSWLERLFN